VITGEGGGKPKEKRSSAEEKTNRKRGEEK